MKKYVFAFVAGLFCMAILAGPAGAFRIAARSNVSGIFRDIQVCTDGLQFDIGQQDVGIGSEFENFPVGTTPAASRNENLYITSDSTPLTDAPSVALVETAFTTLLGTFVVEPIANNDPYILASNLNTPTHRQYWLSTYAEPWNLQSGDTTLAVGTTLYVYSEQGGPTDPPWIEQITVTDCELFGGDESPCDSDDAILGTDGRDVIFGTSGNDIICAFGGKDIVFGKGGNDLILGGDGRDVLIGGPGNDELYGEAGKDLLIGNAGADLLDGGDGADKLFGNRGDDTLIGGPGSDRLYGGSGTDTETQ
jgi:Ca2+-binding RTX toxin-like protein